MESLGQPKQQLVKLSITVDELPVSGAQLWSDDSTNGTPIGVVTSSAISPMGGSVPVAIAMVLKKCNTIGTTNKLAIKIMLQYF